MFNRIGCIESYSFAKTGLLMINHRQIQKNCILPHNCPRIRFYTCIESSSFIAVIGCSNVMRGRIAVDTSTSRSSRVRCTLTLPYIGGVTTISTSLFSLRKNWVAYCQYGVYCHSPSQERLAGRSGNRKWFHLFEYS